MADKDREQVDDALGELEELAGTSRAERLKKRTASEPDEASDLAGEQDEPSEVEEPEFDSLGEPPLVDPAADARAAAPAVDVAGESEQEAPAVPVLPDPGDDSSDGWEEGWLRVVRPYLAKLSTHLGDRGTSDHSITIPMGSSRLMLRPEEQQLVMDFARGVAPAERRSLLLLFGVGLRVKIVADLRKLGKVQGEARYALMGMLGSDAELGYELQRELAREAQRLTGAGMPEQARALTDCQRRLTDRVTRADKASGGDPVLRSGPKPKIEDPGEGPAYDWEKMAAEAAEEACQRASEPGAPGRPGNRKRKKKERDPRAEKRRRVCLALLVVCLAVSLFNVWSYLPHELDHYSMADLEGVPAVEHVLNRPPELLVVVSNQEWNSLSREEKEQAVKLVADLVRKAGYKRVEFRSVSQANLAEWTRRHGVMLH